MIERLKRRFKQEKGFTLVELLAVIAILAIVVAVAVPTVGNVISSSEDKADTANKELMENAARLANVNGVDPKSDNSYSLKNLQKNGYLEEVPVDPTTNDDSKYEGSVKREEIMESGNNSDVTGYKFTYEE